MFDLMLLIAAVLSTVLFFVAVLLCAGYILAIAWGIFCDGWRTGRKHWAWLSTPPPPS